MSKTEIKDVWEERTAGVRLRQEPRGMEEGHTPLGLGVWRSKMETEDPGGACVHRGHARVRQERRNNDMSRLQTSRVWISTPGTTV